MQGQNVFVLDVQSLLDKMVKLIFHLNGSVVQQNLPGLFIWSLVRRVDVPAEGLAHSVIFDTPFVDLQRLKRRLPGQVATGSYQVRLEAVDAGDTTKEEGQIVFHHHQRLLHLIRDSDNRIHFFHRLHGFH